MLLGVAPTVSNKQTKKGNAEVTGKRVFRGGKVKLIEGGWCCPGKLKHASKKREENKNVSSLKSGGCQAMAGAESGERRISPIRKTGREGRGGLGEVKTEKTLRTCLKDDQKGEMKEHVAISRQEREGRRRTFFFLFATPFFLLPPPPY